MLRRQWRRGGLAADETLTACNSRIAIGAGPSMDAPGHNQSGQQEAAVEADFETSPTRGGV